MPPRPRPPYDLNTVYVIAEEQHGHWMAWYVDCPHRAFGGRDAGEALQRLCGSAEDPTYYETWSVGPRAEFRQSETLRFFGGWDEERAVKHFATCIWIQNTSGTQVTCFNL